ncbi:MAG: helix-turn-helix transcriptional regulator [Ignavibacteriae bacterium]|nr:helix-turn-helix transcriptional regulator [Ignavibacteria bacterium]MBI3365034.1 helix-turn-helix transcriptional regulator [Ignavibacteriota bacterium]
MTLGQALKKYRKKHKLVQKELAAKIGISLKHYAQIERGKAYPSQIVLQRICEVTTIAVEFTVGRNRVSEATTKYLIGLKTKNT